MSGGISEFFSRNITQGCFSSTKTELEHSTSCTDIKSIWTQSPLLDGFIESLKLHFPKVIPISKLQMKLEALLLLKLSTVPRLPLSPPEISHVFCGTLRLLLRNPKHAFFRVFPCNSQLLHPCSTLTAKYPKYCRNQVRNHHQQVVQALSEEQFLPEHN